MITILHLRDSDDGCFHRVFRNGTEIDPDIVDVDPGRGYSAADFAEQWHYARNRTDAGPLREAIDGAFRDAGTSQYILGTLGSCDTCEQPAFRSAFQDDGNWLHGDTEQDDDHPAQVTQ